MEFTERLLKINPGIPELPTIYPTTYKVCGKVISENPQEISINQEGSMQEIVIKSELNTGIFCKYLSPGTYEFQVVKFDHGLQ